MASFSGFVMVPALLLGLFRVSFSSYGRRFRM